MAHAIINVSVDTCFCTSIYSILKCPFYFVWEFMKLFKSLLVAPAALGLLAPMTASANEINLADVSDYSTQE